jgi:carbonic anhydrase/acetyltransferase-like protein (isoleucine patch superfamily)
MSAKTPCPPPLVVLRGETPASSHWLGEPLEARRSRALARAKLESGPDDPSRERLVLAADLAVTAEALTAMLEAGRATGSPVTLVPGGEIGRLLSLCALGREPFLAAWLPPGAPMDGVATLPEKVWSPKEWVWDMGTLYRRASSLRVPMTREIAFPTSHWLQALWANLVGLPSFLWDEIIGRNPVLAFLRVLGAVFRARSLSPLRVASCLNRVGRKVRIHPSAVVENSSLGDGVVIGANAVIRASVLAEGVMVEDNAIVSVSVLGPRVLVQRQAIVCFSVLNADSACGGAMQLGCLGAGASVKYGATLLDMNLERDVRVRGLDGALHEAPFGMAGVSVGASTVLGHGVRVAPGRAIAPNLRIIERPSTLLTRVDAFEPGATHAVVDGRLEVL